MESKPLNLTLNTNIEELKIHRLISVRTYNVLNRLGKQTLEDILNLNPKSLQQAWHCGKRTLFEVEDITKRFSYLIRRNGEYIPKSMQALSDYISRRLDSLPDGVASDLKTVYGENLSGFASAYYNPAEVFEKIKLNDFKKNEAVREAIVNLTNEGSAELSVIMFGHKEIDNFLNFLNSWNKYYSELDKLNLLEPVIRENFESQLQNDFSQLAVRTRNCFGNFLNMEFVIRVAFAPENLNITAFKNCGAKTMREFKQFVEEASAKYSEMIDGLYEKGLDDTIRLEGIKERIERLFPFLDDDMATEAARLTWDNGKQPAFYLLMRFVEHGTTQAAYIYREYFGLGSSRERHSMARIASDLGITQERVRQIRSIRLPLPPALENLVSGITDLFKEPVVSAENPVWKELARTNGLDLTPFQMMGLVTSLDSNYRVLEIDSDHLYLVRKDLFDGIKFRTILSKIEAILKRRHNEDIEIDIRDVIYQSRTTANFSPDLHLLVDIIGDYFSEYEEVHSVNDGIIHVKSNRIDKVKGIENVLSEAGRALTFDELIELYHRKYPQYPIQNRDSFRSYVIRSEQIIAKGKTGIYVLNDWTDHFHGSQTDYIHHIVESSENPVNLDDLVAIVKKEFPNSSKSSVYTLIYMDRLKRYNIFDGWLIGLKSRHYEEVTLRTPRGNNELTPEKRLEILKEFIKTNRRFPISVGKKEGEEPLYRWVYNVLRNKISVSDKVKSELESILEKETELPRNSDEANFRDKVEGVISIIEKFKRLPDKKEDPELYKWFKKYSRIDTEFGDRRDIYINRLHEELSKLASSQHLF